MKKLFSIAALLLIAFTSIFVFPYGGQADEASNQRDAELAVSVASFGLGEPQSFASISKDSSNDGIGTRAVMVNKNDSEHTITAMVRVSNDTVAVWVLDYSSPNLTSATSLLFDEKAPLCILSYSVNYETKDYVYYNPKGKNFRSYSEFLNQVEKIKHSLFDNTMTADRVNYDSLLSQFPGIDWGMTREELFNLYGSKQFKENELDMDVPDFGKIVSSYLTAEVSVGQNVVSYFFSFDKVTKGLNSITVMFEDDQQLSNYIDELSVRYGSPKKTSSGNTVMGVQEDVNGDMYYWQVGSTYIIADPSGLHNIVYKKVS